METILCIRSQDNSKFIPWSLLESTLIKTVSVILASLTMERINSARKCAIPISIKKISKTTFNITECWLLSILIHWYRLFNKNSLYS